MCRILFLKWNNTQKAQEYLDGFYNAWRNDPYLKKIVEEFKIPGVKNEHNHGWGYILVSKNAIHHYANGLFFHEDVSGKEILEKALSGISGDFILMAELRVTDLWYVSAFNAHPFMFQSQNGYEGYLFYNGLLDYEKLAECEALDFQNYTTKNGTTLMGMSIARALESGQDMKQALERPKCALQSAYNLMMFYRDNKGKYKSCMQSYISETLLKNKIVFDHNKLLKKEESDMFFMGSSTIELYKKWEYEVMKNGEYIEFDVDFIEEYFFDGYK